MSEQLAAKRKELRETLEKAVKHSNKDTTIILQNVINDLESKARGL